MAESVKESALKASLKRLIEQWLHDEDHQDNSICYIGDNTGACMADAAFGVLTGIADAEAYHKREHALNCG
jgi:hypothetical protein